MGLTRTRRRTSEKPCAATESLVQDGQLWYKKIMDTDTRSIVSRLKNSLESLYGSRLSRLILYGSQVRGDADRYSDIDVLVVLKGPVKPGDEIARTGGIVADLSLQIDKVITCIFMDEERYLHRAGPLLRNIRREGVAI